MAAHPFLAVLLLAAAAASPPVARAQQEYEANLQNDCYARNTSSTLGYTCNAATTTTSPSPPCDAYLIFRSSPPLYSSAVSISFLLNTTASTLAAFNSIDDPVTPIPSSHLVLAPIPCGCTPAGYYQHNATHTIRNSGLETYFIIANLTFQGLSTCQSLIAQNPLHDSRGLVAGDNLTVPLRCACPSPAQAAAGVRYLVTYLVMWGDDVSSIAERFRVDAQDVLDANTLAESSIIYPFTTLLIPLKSKPTVDMLVSPAPPPVTAAADSSGGSGKWVAVGVGVGCGVLALGGLIGFVFLCVRRRRRRLGGVGGSDRRQEKVVVDVSSSAEYGVLASGKQTTTNTNTTTTNSSSVSKSLMASEVREALESLTVYKYSELEKATAGFSDERRVPGTGVYRGVFNGDAAAVKRVAGDVTGEVGILKRVNHSSLIRLSGLCLHRGDTYLVFEFADNGALSDWLHAGAGDAAGILRWRQRIQVAFDVADGLNYLHNYTNPPCVHKNLKSSNVLLDGDLHGKLSGFGLARALPAGDAAAAQLTRHVVGTQGYLSPEYLEHGLITPKLDVFAFGVILLEILSGKEAAFAGDGDGGERLLWETAEGLVGDGEKVRDFMDPRLGGDYPLDMAVAVAALAARCVAREPAARPAMDGVFVSLAAVYNSTMDWDPSDHGNSGSSLIGR
uniref:Protein kinase domain-containing protein n=1 Tax=Leersia perrieri TaxID=77586 RepID=A0A0D9VD86_9ORYZ